VCVSFIPVNNPPAEIFAAMKGPKKRKMKKKKQK